MEPGQFEGLDNQQETKPCKLKEVGSSETIRENDGLTRRKI
jgi:hypothetical protein